MFECGNGLLQPSGTAAPFSLVEAPSNVLYRVDQEKCGNWKSRDRNEHLSQTDKLHLDTHCHWTGWCGARGCRATLLGSAVQHSYEQGQGVTSLPQTPLFSCLTTRPGAVNTLTHLCTTLHNVIGDVSSVAGRD